MLSPRDFQEKQILIINEASKEKSGIRFRNENVVLIKDDKIENQISCHKVFSLFIIGNTTITSKLIEKSSQHNISIFLLKNNLEQYASINSEAEGNFLIRAKQYRINDNSFLAKEIVKNKIRNQLFLLKKRKLIAKDMTDRMFGLACEKIEKATGNKTLLGIEGNISRVYFRLLFSEYKWYRRMPRTKVDTTNALLDIGYTYLFNFVDSVIGLYGFDKYKGFYHTMFFQRKSLTCDIMEPFRPIIDQCLLRAYHLKQVNESDFKFKNGQYVIKYQEGSKYSKIFLKEILGYKMQIFKYVKDFYKYVSDSNKDFPCFLIK